MADVPDKKVDLLDWFDEEKLKPMLMISVGLIIICVVGSALIPAGVVIPNAPQNTTILQDITGNNSTILNRVIPMITQSNDTVIEEPTEILENYTAIPTETMVSLADASKGALSDMNSRGAEQESDNDDAGNQSTNITESLNNSTVINPINNSTVETTPIVNITENITTTPVVNQTPDQNVTPVITPTENVTQPVITPTENITVTPTPTPVQTPTPEQTPVPTPTPVITPTPAPTPTQVVVITPDNTNNGNSTPIG